jgi:hypothetical protein
MGLPEGSYTQWTHIVRDLETSARKWTDATGAGPWFVMEPPVTNTVYRGKSIDLHYRLALTFIGTSIFELISPLDDGPSIFTEALNERGEGFFLLSPRVTALSGESFDARIEEMKGRGFTVAMTTEVIGVGRTCYFDAVNSIGAFIELLEIGAAYPTLDVMAEIHAQWDGTDLLRDFSTVFGGA